MSVHPPSVEDMFETASVDPVEQAGDPAQPRADLLTVIAELSLLPSSENETEAIDRIRLLEELKGACAAAQAREASALYRMRCAAQEAEGIPGKERGRGVAAEVALARRDSPSRGSQHLGLGRTLVADMPHTLAALSAGRISEWVATSVCREVICLSAADRRRVDELIKDLLGEISLGRLRGRVRALVQELDQAAVVAQREREKAQRHVSVRPAPGDMAYLTALVPLRQAISVYATLRRDAATLVGVGDADGRSPSQVMADLLVERATGQITAPAVPAEVQLIMTDRALLGGEDIPAWIPGHGPVAASSARTWVRDEALEVFLRRLYVDPESGQLVGMESRRREFPESLRRMVILRDDVCRTPYCDAQIKHLDHAVSARSGGETSWGNGSGLCARCNYTKENPGWSHQADPGWLDVTTPTGHRYRTETESLVRKMHAGADPPQPCTAAERAAGRLPPIEIPQGWVPRVNVEWIRLVPT